MSGNVANVNKVPDYDLDRHETLFENLGLGMSPSGRAQVEHT
jgi:hypothetical protein